MDQADEELRETIKNIWPLQAKKILDLLVPIHDGKNRTPYLFNRLNGLYHTKVFPFVEVNEGKLTVGKIYAGFQILECWRSTKFKKTDGGNPPVSIHLEAYKVPNR